MVHGGNFMKKTILIVEDDENIIEGLTDVLTEKDYEILAATNEKTAISCVDSNNVSLVIMDVNLGVENGFDICKSIRSLSDIPILFLTACDSEMELVRGFQVILTQALLKIIIKEEINKNNNKK